MQTTHEALPTDPTISPRSTVDELRDAEARLAKLEASQALAEEELTRARVDLSNGRTSIEDVGAAESRLNALRGTVEDLRPIVEELRDANEADAAEARRDAMMAAFSKQGCASSALVREFAKKLIELQSVVLQFEESQRLRGGMYDRLRRAGVDSPERGLPEDAIPDVTWRRFVGLIGLWRAIAPKVRALDFTTTGTPDRT